MAAANSEPNLRLTGLSGGIWLSNVKSVPHACETSLFKPMAAVQKRAEQTPSGLRCVAAMC
jgi:hypothetical protein